MYQAAELNRPLRERQIPGLDLKAYYESYSGSTDSASLETEGGQPNYAAMRKKVIQDLRASDVSQLATKHGPDGWECAGIGSVTPTSSNRQNVRVGVVMHNTKQPSRAVLITLERQLEAENKAVAQWCVRDQQTVD
jgi:hypothetical protein